MVEADGHAGARGSRLLWVCVCWVRSMQTSSTLTAVDQCCSKRLPASITLAPFTTEDGIIFEVEVVDKSTTDLRDLG